MKTRVEYLEALYGIWWAGAVVAPINAKLHVKEAVKLGSDESFYNLMIYGVFTDLSAAIKRDLQRYRRP